MSLAKFSEVLKEISKNRSKIISITIEEFDQDSIGEIKTREFKFPRRKKPKEVCAECTTTIEKIPIEPEEVPSNQIGQKRPQTRSGGAIQAKQRKIADQCEASEVPIEHLNPKNIQTRSKNPQTNDKLNENETEMFRRPKKAVNKTSMSRESAERAKLTLSRLSDNDRLCVALSEALGQALVNGKRITRKIRDPYCWQCHKKPAENGVGQRCQFCPISFCQPCLDKNVKSKLKKRNKETLAKKQIEEILNPLMKFPIEMPQMDPECEGMISSKWRNGLAGKNVCYNCVNRVADALFNRTLGFMTSDYERKESNLLFSDVVGVLMALITQEQNELNAKNKEENENDVQVENAAQASKIVCYNSLIKVSQREQPSDDVVAPMTLKMIEKKADNREYRSTKDFWFDINLILHNLRIEKGVDVIRKEHQIWKIHEWLLKQLRFIDMCATCGRNYYLTPAGKTGDNGIDIPCGNPHSIVWAKYRHNWFPAKVFECRLPGSFVVQKEVVYVQFFGQGDIYLYNPQKMLISNLYLYSKKTPQQQELNDNLQKQFNDAQKLVDKFLDNLDLFYDNQYEVPEEPKRLTAETLYIPDIGEYHEEAVRGAGYFTQNSE